MSSDSKKVLEKEIKTREMELKKLEIEIGVFKEALRIISIPASSVVVHSPIRSDSSKEASLKSEGGDEFEIWPGTIFPKWRSSRS